MSVTASPQQNHLRDLAIAAIKQAHREIGQADQRLLALEEPAVRPEKQNKVAPQPADELPPAAAPPPRARRHRPLLWSFLGLLASAGIAAAALAWQKSSELAALDPIFTATISAAKRYLPEQPAPSVGAARTEPALPQPSPQTSPQREAQLIQAAPSPAPPQVMPRELANVQQQAIDQIKTERAQMIRDNAEMAERLKATQEMASRNAKLVEDLKATQAQIIRRNADLADDLKAARSQAARDNAEFAERLKASQEQMAKLSEQIKTSQDQLARLTAAEHKPRPKPVASAPTAIAAAVRRPATTAPPSPQARAQAQDARRLMQQRPQPPQ
jgi:hypothetical protein